MERRGLAGFGGELAIPLGAALLVYALVVFAPQILNDGDTYWHIIAGARMLAQHAVLTHDPFSHTFAGAPWQTQEWLSEIFMALAYRLAAWNGVVLLFGIAAGTAAGLLAFHLGRWLPRQAQLLVLVLGFACTAPSLLARPHLLALPILELWTASLLIASHEGRRPPFWLLPFMAIWANLHGSFPLGIALAGLLGFEAWLSADHKWECARDWGLFLAGTVIAALITPHGVSGLLFPLHLMTMTGLSFIGEWAPTDFSHFGPFQIAILAALYFGFTRDLRVPPFRALIILLFVYLALQHSRHQIVFAIVAPLLLAEGIAREKGAPMRAIFRRAEWGPVAAAAMAAVLIATLRFAHPIARKDDSVSPITALAHVPASLAAKPVLNEYAFGGYLIFNGVKTFIDSRADMYGDDFLRNYAAITRPDEAAFDQAVAKYGIRWTILRPASPLAAMLDASPHWRRLYADNFAVVHVLKQ